MRRAATLTAAIVVMGVLALALTALIDHRSEAFTLGVTSSGPIALRAGSEACQTPIAVPASASFDAVTFGLGTDHRPGPAIDVRIRDARSGSVLARGRLPAGYPDVDQVPRHTVHVGPVAAGRTIAACLADRGPRRVFVYGNAAAAARTSQTVIDGKAQPVDMDLTFERRSPRSLAALTGAMFHRASLFRAGWVGSWTYVVLALLVLLAVPALVVAAVRSATRSSTPARRSPSAGQP